MFVDDMKSARKASLALLMLTVQIVIIITFGGGWTQWTTTFLAKYTGSPYSLLVPVPVSAPWWVYVTAVTMYISLTLAILYIGWTVAQVAVPDRIPFDLKMVLFIDMLVSGIFTILLLIAYCFFAGGFSGTSTPYVALGYCFWFGVVGSIASTASLIISGLGWFRN